MAENKVILLQVKSNLFVLIFICFGFCIFLSACTGILRRETKSPPACPQIPPGFKEEDLIGTWFIRYAAGNNDTLILREDGTYQQKYADPYTGENYQSDWKMWSIEPRPNGLLRLHLEGMRRCDSLDAICARVEGGMGTDIYKAVDECEGNQLVEMPDEVILVVTGTPEYYKIPTLRGIVLNTTRIVGDPGTYAFELQPEK
jgi:hypothetical protein